MATRHHYTIDTVGATLLHALTNGMDVLAIQAAKEISVSEEQGLLMNLLSLAWFLAPPDHPQQRQRYEAFVGNEPSHLLAALLGSVCDLPSVPIVEQLQPPKYGTRPPPSSWTRWPKGWTAEQAGALYYAVESALKHGSWRRATALTMPFLSGNRLAISGLLTAMGVHKRLTDIFTTTVFEPLCHRIVEHAYASAIAKPFAKPLRKLNLSTTTNHRAERTFTISATACSTWSVRSRPDSELMGAPIHITKEPTEFWRKALTQFNITATSDRLVLDDAVSESFYETYFPSDIPDEWSAEERKKSHGLVIPPAQTPNIWQTAFLLCWSTRT